MGRNAGLPVSHLAEALLDVRPFEEPSAALSRVPVQGRTPVPLRGGLYVCTGGFGIISRMNAVLGQRVFSGKLVTPSVPWYSN
jgi:hypothetical protein